MSKRKYKPIRRERDNSFEFLAEQSGFRRGMRDEAPCRRGLRFTAGTGRLGRASVDLASMIHQRTEALGTSSERASSTLR